MEIRVDEGKLKELMKEALLELLEDRKEVIYEILSDVIEDIALARAIKEGEASERVGKQEILEILRAVRREGRIPSKFCQRPEGNQGWGSSQAGSGGN